MKLRPKRTRLNLSLLAKGRIVHENINDIFRVCREAGFFFSHSSERVGRKHVAGIASRKDCSDEGGINSETCFTCMGVLGDKRELFRLFSV